MKNIIIILVVYCICISNTFADIGFCDNANINFNKYTFNDICNDGIRINNISNISTFIGKYINIKSGYFGNKNNLNMNFEKNIMKIGYLGNKNKNIKFIKYINLFKVGYLGNKFNNNKNINLNNNTLVYNFYLGYLGNFKIIKKNINKKKNNKIIIKQKTYSCILEEYIKQNSTSFAIENTISLKDYNNFVDNILEIIFNGSEGKIFIGDDIEKIKIEIAKTDFLNKIKILVKNIKEINRGFSSLKGRNEKFYMLDYYLK